MQPGPSPRAALAGARWISPAELSPAPAGERPAYLLQTSFSTDGTLRTQARADIRTTIHATAHGIYELFLNGVRVGDEELTPGFTAYRSRLQVHSWDITDNLRPGTNTVTILLSDGWFRGRHGFERRADGFGHRVGAIAAVRRTSTTDANDDQSDGQVETTDVSAGELIVGTGEQWRWRLSHITRADLMDGQAEDHCLFDPQWFTGGGQGWQPVELLHDALTEDRDRLVPAADPAVRRQRRLTPVAITSPRPGTFVVDFGQNINGWVHLGALGAFGPVGTTLRLTYGESLDPAGLLTMEHLRSFHFATGQLLPAGQVDSVVTGPDPEAAFEPRHTTHGFRYLQVDGVDLQQWVSPHASSADDDNDNHEDRENRPVAEPVARLSRLIRSTVHAVFVHSDLSRAGEFSCSDPRLEQLHEVVRWSLLGNACAIPTDCPQRERSGFTGDWQVFVGTATLLQDVKAFSERWLLDLAADQWPDGRVPTVVPNPSGSGPSGNEFEDQATGSAGWGDAAVIVPWELFRAYGDLNALRRSLPSAVAWVTYAAAQAAAKRHPDRATSRPEPAEHERYLWDTGFHFGEWLEPGVAPNPDASVDHGIVATAYLSRSAELTARMAGLVDDEETARWAREVAEHAREAWQREYIGADGFLTQESQANYVRALAFDLVPAEGRAAVAKRLAELVAAAGDRLGTGFLSTGMLLPTLADAGYPDLAHRVLTSDGNPSWLGMLTAGATTVWEWWDGVDADGAARGSLNHYSKGAVASFLHTHVTGIRLPEDPQADEAGYRTVQIRPVPGPTLTRAHSALQTAAGPLVVAWQRDATTFTLDLDLPAATTAEVDLPDGTRREVAGGTHRFTCPVPAAQAPQLSTIHRGDRA
ncbi:alpha-L-rhamnosidase [Kineococcus rhizosphaerae]|uniref:alpha-L-rhamnosidase n=1 Tax=Kineococcus rhizosphaerae TaxID=559628 RepID=A0A2T0QPB9_9ACTN|nr:alpha-L-rhamnosidase [Kineococcus rhizosphaerae]